MNKTPNAVITRHKNTKNYTKITKQLVFNTYSEDRHLSMEEKGLLLTLLSLPEGWNVNIQGLATLNSCSLNKVERVMKNLKEKGFVEMQKLKGECLYYIYEQPKKINSKENISNEYETENENVTNKTTMQTQNVNKQVTDILYNSDEMIANKVQNVNYNITKNVMEETKNEEITEQNVTKQFTEYDENIAEMLSELLENVTKQFTKNVTNNTTKFDEKKFNDCRFYNCKISQLYRTLYYITKSLSYFSKTTFYKNTKDNLELFDFLRENPLAKDSLINIINNITKGNIPLVKNTNLLNLEKKQLVKSINKFPIEKTKLNNGARLTFLNNSTKKSHKEKKEEDMRELPKIKKPATAKPKKKPRTESLENILNTTVGQLTQQDNELAQTKKQLNIEKEKNETLERKQAKVLSNRRKVLNLLEQTFNTNPRLLSKLKDFVEVYIAKRGVITVPAMKALLTDLCRMAKSEEDAIRIVNNSVKCSYIAFYKDEPGKQQSYGKSDSTPHNFSRDYER